MLSQWLGQAKINVRKALSQLRSCLGQITANVNARRKKIRHEDDALGSLLYATRAARSDVRLGQLQKRRLNDGPAARSQSGGDEEEIGVGLLLPAAMSDEQQSRRHKASPRF